MKNDEPFAFAGLWDACRVPDGTWLQSYSIVTTDANELLISARIHDRMPVILDPKDYDRSLDREGQRPPTDLLRPYDAAKMIANHCNPKVSNVKNNGPEILNSA